jgi:hypothetical protein
MGWQYALTHCSGTPAQGGSQEGLLPVLEWPTDFTRLGAYRVPGPDPGVSTADWHYMYGLSVRYEPSDVTQPVHLVSSTFHGGTGNANSGGWVFEFRDRTPENPADPTDLTEYTSAPFPEKEYGNIFGTVDVDYKRLYYNGENITQFANVAGTDPRVGLYWDSDDERLYWCYAETYSGDDGNEPNNWHFGYSELDYATGASTPHGPWRLDSGKFKTGFGGFVRLPEAFVTGANLGAETMAIGFGGYGSVVGAGDCSLGPALTAFVPPTGATTEQTALSSTPLIGYWPTVGTEGVGRDRATRPAGYETLQSGINPYDSWPDDKWNWNDGNYSYGVFIHGANKAGLVIFTSLTAGLSNYLNATFGYEQQIDVVQIVSEQDLADVANGVKEKHEIQATTTPLTLDSMDYTQLPWGVTVLANISSITSEVGESMGERSDPPVENDYLDPDFYHCTITTDAAHGLNTGDTVSIRGTSRDSEYRGVWQVNVTGATTFKIRNTSFHGYTWSGNGATGGAVRTSGGGSPENFRGVAFDPATNKLYVMYYHYPIEDLVMEVFEVNC